MQELLRNQTVSPRTRTGHAPAPGPAAKATAPAARHPLRQVLIGATAGLVVLAAVVLPLLNATTIDAQQFDENLGAGYTQLDRSVARSYVVREGDTLGEIAYLHGLDYNTLARYNKLKNPDRLLRGQILKIPSIANEKAFRKQSTSQAASLTRPATPPAGSNVRLQIQAEKQYDGTALTAHFSVVDLKGLEVSSWEWDLGNGHRAFRDNPFWSYEQPGTYTVRLKARLKSGALVSSDPLFIDVPHPGSYLGNNQQFITLGNLQDTFRLPGEILSVNGKSDPDGLPISRVGSDGEFGIYQAVKPGYYAIEVAQAGQNLTVYLFASPIPTVHVERSDLNWYRTQFNTGALSNCGPSSVAMAYAWAKGGYLPVSTVRQAVGFKGNGSTSFSELTRVLNSNDVSYQTLQARRSGSIFAAIDDNQIAIVLINTGGIRKSNGLNDLFGRYYSDVVGHYIVIKGYSVDRRFFVVYDPIPSDWGSNSFRFADGISMSGRNRYYPVEDVMKALRTQDFLAISRG